MKPPRLKPGDRIGLVALGSRPESPGAVRRSARVVEELGLVPVPGKHILDVHGHLAGKDCDRLADLNAFCADDSIAGVFCLCGGFGALSLLSKIDYECIRRRPKVFLGSDENSALLLSINKVCGLTTFLGPNLDRVRKADSFNGIKNALLSSAHLELLCDFDSLGTGIEISRSYSPHSGTVSGIVMGGNLSALISIMGTPFQPDFQNVILYLDDYSERLDILDRWFNTLYLAGALALANGVVFGAFDACGARGSPNVLSIEDLFGERLFQLKKPSLFGLPLGHTFTSATIPLGVAAELNTDRTRLTFLDYGTDPHR